jgi:hypothetical protein
MIAYLKSLELGLTGTDTAIVNDLQVITASNIKASDAVEWLREGGYWQEGPGGMSGTLVTAYNASVAANRKRFDDVWGLLYSAKADVLITSRPLQASRVWFVIAQIPGITGAIRNSFYALGGGRPFATLTDAEFAAQRTAYLAAQALDDSKAPLRQAAVDRYNTFINALDAWDGSGQAPVL